MDIVLLCAGSSSRMGRINKLLLPLGDTTMVANSAMQALKYLEKRNDGSSLIVVTGYRRFSTEKALKPCKTYIEKTDSKINMIIVCNKDYRKGQFTSIKTGVRQVTENSDFFIALSDMPGITEYHYKELEDKLENHDAVRAVYNSIPGHPVLLSKNMRQVILKAKSNNRVSRLLQTKDLCAVNTDDPAYIQDIDTQTDLESGFYKS